MSKRVRYILFTLVFCLFAAQVIRPARTNPAIDRELTIQARMRIPLDVADILERSCQDCHAHTTDWPWYSEVAPISWLLISDVDEGRRVLNYSIWGQYNRKEQIALLDATCREVRKGDMPLWYYLPLHPKARLSQAEVRELCTWTEQAKQ